MTPRVKKIVRTHETVVRLGLHCRYLRHGDLVSAIRDKLPKCETVKILRSTVDDLNQRIAITVEYTTVRRVIRGRRLKPYPAPVI